MILFGVLSHRAEASEIAWPVDAFKRFWTSVKRRSTRAPREGDGP